MKWDEWRFSTRLAWENSVIKWTSVVTLFFLIVASALALVRLLMVSLPSGYVVTHYTVYLGIDQVTAVPWLFLLVFVPILLISATILCGFSIYRKDGIAGLALVLLSAASTAIWCFHLYYLTRINI